MRRHSGFTLVEILVVLGILMLLMTVLLSGIAGARDTAMLTACKLRMHKVHQAVLQHEVRRGRMPRGGGNDFLYDLWRGGKPSKDTRELMFCPECQKYGAHEHVERLDPRRTWQERPDFDESSTDWATVRREHKRSWDDANEIVLADRSALNHGGEAINVMYGSGRTETIFLDDLVRDGILAAGERLRIGPDSQLEALRKLSRR